MHINLLWFKKIIWWCTCHSEARPQSRYTRIKGNNVDIWVGNKKWASIGQGKGIALPSHHNCLHLFDSYLHT